MEQALIKILGEMVAEYGAKARLSRDSGITHTQISRYLSGQISMPWSDLEAIAAALDTTPLALIRKADAKAKVVTVEVSEKAIPAPARQRR